jgi:hypothetical protein
LRAKVDAFNRDMMMLEIRAVPPPPTEREIWEPRLRKAAFGNPLQGPFGYCGYVFEECESLWHILRPGEKIVGFDVWEVKTSLRSISRRELRLGSAQKFRTLLPDWDPEQFLRKNFRELPRRTE